MPEQSVIQPDSSMQWVGLKLHSREATIEEALIWMADGGQSVSLNFGEDTDQLECSWITWAGDRFTGVRATMRDAMIEAVNKAFLAYAEANPEGA